MSAVLACAVLFAADPFAKWEPALAAFDAQDAKSPPPQNAILFVGSSSIRLWDLKKSFPDRNLVNRGFGGSEVADSVHFADRLVLKHKPRQVLLYAGDNDIAHGKSAEQVAADFREFVKVVREELPQTQITFIAIKPSVARWKLAETIKQANSLVQKQTEEDDLLGFVDVWPPMLGEDGKPKPELFREDGLHLNDKGYKVWADLVRPHLVGRMKDR